MDTRKAATEYRLAKWAQVIQTRTSGGQSTKDFCASAGISKNTFFYWQRKLREVACTELVRDEYLAENNLVPSGWARIAALEPSMAEAALKIEVGGCSITATNDTDPELLVRICRVLKAL